MIAISQLIKIVLGLFVVVAVVMGLYFFGSYVSDFFGGLSSEENKTKVQVGDSEISKVEGDEKIENSCDKCGDGATNLCDEKECKSLGISKQCDYSWWNKINPCTLK